MEIDEVEKQGAQLWNTSSVSSETGATLVNLKYPESLSKLSMSIQTPVLLKCFFSIREWSFPTLLESLFSFKPCMKTLFFFSTWFYLKEVLAEIRTILEREETLLPPLLQLSISQAEAELLCASDLPLVWVLWDRCRTFGLLSVEVGTFGWSLCRHLSKEAKWRLLNDVKLSWGKTNPVPAAEESCQKA